MEATLATYGAVILAAIRLVESIIVVTKTKKDDEVLSILKVIREFFRLG